jgi:hypothetical protein
VHTAGFRTRHRFHLHLFEDVEGSNTYLVVPGEGRPPHLCVGGVFAPEGL